MKNILNDIKVGEILFDVTLGNVKVESVNARDRSMKHKPITCFPHPTYMHCIPHNYTNDGKLNASDRHPVLFKSKQIALDYIKFNIG